MRRPNAIQKLLHRFFMQRPVTAFFAPRVQYIDKAILKLTGGQFAACNILGWNVIQLTTIGAKTNQPRTTRLLGLFDEQRIGLIASGFGREHNPSWYYNLKAQPECQVYFKGRAAKYIAHEANGEEYGHYWKLAVSYYAGYEKYKQRAAHRHIPVIVFEPNTEVMK